MNSMIDPSLLKRFLSGDATDEEVRQCELFLCDPANLDDLSEHLDIEGLHQQNGDSLLDTLRNVGERTVRFESGEMVEKIERMVPTSGIGQDELNRVLSPAESEDEIGKIGRYRVVEFIAGGGMGLVFKAEDPDLQRPVCIKVLHPMLATQADAKVRFAREAKAAAKLRNTRIVTVLEVGEHRELPYLVMQLLDGKSLREKLNFEARLQPPEAKKLAIQIGEGLRYAHGLGFLHRDIKPENIWVTTEGDIKLLDFGLARAVNETTNLTNTGTILGTPSYMSPEQVQGKDLDSRSDLFSVGSVMFEMLTGESPFGKSNLFSTMMSVANDPLEFPKANSDNAVPIQLVSVIESLLEKSPDDRIGSADDLIAQLETVDVDSNAELASKKVRGQSGIGSGWIGVLGGIAGAVILALALMLYQMNDKGTLVVEADPSVNVSIANEEVSIHDPKSGKKFKVTIGDHPLPSGVYQLEMLDELGQYSLSSSVIAIRRGEKQIVKVELKPKASGNGSSLVQPAIAEWSGNPTDGSNAGVAKPAIKLAKLPTLSAKELQRKLQIQPDRELRPYSMVTKPEKRDGVTSWSVETTYSKYSASALSADGRRIASYAASDNMLRIWNRKSELVHLIPAQDSVKQVSWSPEADILAVVENGDRRKLVTVWKLFDDQHVEVLEVIPADAMGVSWSWDGLQLAVKKEKEISFVDITKGSVFAHPNFGISGEISQHPWSADGRYFAATIDSGVKVWDLKERKLLNIFAGAEDARFLPSKNELAFKVTGTWEVWDLDAFERKRLIEIDSSWLASWPDHSFKRIAGFGSDQKMFVKDLLSGDTIDVKMPVKETNTNVLRNISQIKWSADGDSLHGKLYRQMFFLEVPENLDATEVLSCKKSGGIVRSHANVDVSRDGLNLSTSKDGKRVAFAVGSYDEPKQVAALELGSSKTFSATNASFFKSGATYQISPDGKSVAFVGSDKNPREKTNQADWANDLAKVRVCSLATGEVTKTIDLKKQVQSFFWSPDSKSICVSNVIGKLPTVSENALEYAKASIEHCDIGGDGRLDETELKKLRLQVGPADHDKDGFVTVEELAWAFARKTQAFYELQVRMFDLASEEFVEFHLDSESVDKLDGSKGEGLCFQSGLSSQGWEYAKPVLRGSRQIAIPLFKAADFRGGSRISSRGREKVVHEDKVGLFDMKTGDLEKVIDLKLEIDLDNLFVSERLIACRKKVDRSKPGNPESWFVVDQSNANVVHPMESWVRLGKNSLAPKYPVFASQGLNSVILWKLDPGMGLRFVRQVPIRVVKKSTSTSSSISRTGLIPKLFSFCWHSEKPIVAWYRTGKISCYNFETNQLIEKEIGQVVYKLLPGNDGWTLFSSSEVIEFDSALNKRQTCITSSQADETWVGKFDQAVSADGKVHNESNKANLRAIQLKGNRFETLAIDVFENQTK